MKGEVDILANFPIDTSLKKKAHSALIMNSYHELNPVCETFDLLAKFDPQVAAEIGAPLAQTEKVENRFFFKNSIEKLLK